MCRRNIHVSSVQVVCVINWKTSFKLQVSDTSKEQQVNITFLLLAFEPKHLSVVQYVGSIVSAYFTASLQAGQALRKICCVIAM